MRTLPAAAAMLILTAASASAHAFLASATPAVGSRVHAAPASVVITFTENVVPAQSSIAVADSAGARVDTGAARIEGSDTVLAVSLKPLAAGPYTVRWHATDTDGHKTQGRFAFTVAP